MQEPAFPPDEADRIATLRRLLILDTPPEERFDTITAYAAAQFKVEAALVSLLDSDRQWFKSSCGLAAKGSPRSLSFCGHAILQNEIFEVVDASRDARFADNPFVTGQPKIRFYAGAPLQMPDGQRMGTLCLIDYFPRRLDDWERAHLLTLSRLVVMELQGISAAAELARLSAER